jgi:hypothetical protein
MILDSIRPKGDGMVYGYTLEYGIYLSLFKSQ